MIIHPGFLKTATTTLQQHLFSAHPELFFLGAPHRSELYTQMTAGFRRIEEVDYDEQKLRTLISSALENKPIDAVPILSSESFTANVYLLKPIAQRLRVFFPEARIIFTIRHQLHVVRSFYARHGRVLTNVPAPYTDRHVTFENWLPHAYRNWPISILGVFDYHRTIQIYERVFGREYIHVFLFEEFVHNQDVFVSRLAEVLSVDAPTARRLLSGKHIHAQESRRAVLYDRFIKRFIPGSWLKPLLPYTTRLRASKRSFLERGHPEKTSIPPKWVPCLKELYESGNRTLAREYNLPLAQYDYP